MAWVDRGMGWKPGSGVGANLDGELRSRCKRQLAAAALRRRSRLEPVSILILTQTSTRCGRKVGLEISSRSPTASVIFVVCRIGGVWADGSPSAFATPTSHAPSLWKAAYYILCMCLCSLISTVECTYLRLQYLVVVLHLFGFWMARFAH